MDNKNENLEMIVDVRTTKGFKDACVVSVLPNQKYQIQKRYVDSIKDSNIRCGSLGVFSDNKFQQLQDYQSTEYDIAQVLRVFKTSHFGDESYDSWHYVVYSSKAGFGSFYPGQFYYDVARPGNIVLLNKGKFVANLTTQENIYDLCNRRNMQKYDLQPVYDNKGKIERYNTATDPNKFAGVPAVVLGAGVCRTPGIFVFIPECPEVNNIEIIRGEGAWQPCPRPSDVVSLLPVNGKNGEEYTLFQNLTMKLETREMDAKFGKTR